MNALPKVELRHAYRTAVSAATRMALPFRSRDRRIAVFYGGARRGSLGGPLVKVGLLASRFPEHRIGYSLLYMLSNAIYLSQSAIEAIGRADVPIVVNQNGVYYRAWYPVGWERENARMAALQVAADHVFYQSEFCRRCADNFLGKRSGPSEILYNAVDTARFSPMPLSAERRPFTFLITGKIFPSTAYSLRAAIAGFAAARRGGLDVHLRIAGAIDAVSLKEMHDLLERERLTDAVTFLGPYRHDDAPALYGSADAYLTAKCNDSCPNAVIEALSSGLPVLYSASGGVPELVGEEAGVGLTISESFEETPTPSPEAIAEGMARIVRARETMSMAARSRAVARFDIETWFARHQAVFAGLMTSRPR